MNAKEYNQIIEMLGSRSLYYAIQDIRDYIKRLNPDKNDFDRILSLIAQSSRWNRRQRTIDALKQIAFLVAAVVFGITFGIAVVTLITKLNLLQR